MTRTLRLMANAFFLLLIFLNSYSQNIKDHGYISLSVGPAFPVGKYAASNVFDPAAGLAKTGAFFTASYARLLSKKNGFIIAAHAQRNGVNTKAVENSFSNTPINTSFFGTTIGGPPATPPQSSGTIYPNWKFDKSAWLFGSVMAGWYGEFPLKNERMAIIAKVMGGAVYAKYPKLNGTSVTDTTMAHAESNSKWAFGVSYAVDAGIRYSINKKVYFLANLGYLGTNAIKFKGLTSTLLIAKKNPLLPFGYSETVQQTMTGTGKQTISSINFHAGIGLKL